MKENIYRKLRLSIRKINEDEIEIRHSLIGGYTRGFIRYLFIGILLITVYTDVFKYHRPVFSNIYTAIQKDFTWAFNPDKKIMPLYKKYVLVEHDPDYFKRHPEKYPPRTYEEFKKPYVTEDFWKRHRAYLHFIWIPLLLLLIFLPIPRGLRLNRKHRMIYTNFAATPVPDKGDPLSGLIYDRFGKYMFGQAGFLGMFGGFKYFSLTVILPNKKREPVTLQFGVYPTPNVNHNLHIVKAMREFFTEEDPEFLQYIDKRYRIPITEHPLIFFCNSFTLPSFFSTRKMREKALIQLAEEWTSLPKSQQKERFAELSAKQKAINAHWQSQGFINEVNDDWDEMDVSPLMK